MNTNFINIITIINNNNFVKGKYGMIIYRAAEDSSADNGHELYDIDKLWRIQIFNGEKEHFKYFRDLNWENLYKNYSETYLEMERKQ